MVQDNLKLTGKLQIALNGKVIQETDNLVVTTGKGYVASRIKSDVSGGSALMSHMAIGSGSTAAAAANTTLGSELGRVALASTAVSGAIVTYTASFPAGTGTGAVTEAGVFNASSSGTLLCRTVFSVVNKGAADSITITWTVTVS